VGKKKKRKTESFQKEKKDQTSLDCNQPALGKSHDFTLLFLGMVRWVRSTYPCQTWLYRRKTKNKNQKKMKEKTN